MIFLHFYVLFPHFMKHIKPLPAELRSFKKIIQRIPEPYESIKNVKRILYELESIQTVAIQNLLAKNLIDIESFKHKKLMRTKTELPAKIKQNMKSSNIFNEEWFRLLINEIPLLNFLGKKGLKSRAGLMEYRYDLEKV